MYKSKMGQDKTFFGQYKSNYRTVQDNVSTKSGDFLDSTWWFFLLIKLNCGYGQVEIGTVWDEKWANYWDIKQDNFWTVPVDIGTVWDASRQNQMKFLDSTWWLFQQNKLNIGYVQVKIGTVQDKLQTVQVKYWAAQDNGTTKLGAIFGQYMLIFSTNKV